MRATLAVPVGRGGAVLREAYDTQLSFLDDRDSALPESAARERLTSRRVGAVLLCLDLLDEDEALRPDIPDLLRPDIPLPDLREPEKWPLRREEGALREEEKEWSEVAGLPTDEVVDSSTLASSTSCTLNRGVLFE